MMSDYDIERISNLIDAKIRIAKAEESQKLIRICKAILEELKETPTFAKGRG